MMAKSFFAVKAVRRLAKVDKAPFFKLERSFYREGVGPGWILHRSSSWKVILPFGHLAEVNNAAFLKLEGYFGGKAGRRLVYFYAFRNFVNHLAKQFPL